VRRGVADGKCADEIVVRSEITNDGIGAGGPVVNVLRGQCDGCLGGVSWAARPV